MNPIYEQHKRSEAFKKSEAKKTLNKKAMGKDKCTLNNKELANKVSDGISKLCETGGKSFTMHVPARVDEDLDLLVSEMVFRFRELCETELCSKSNCNRAKLDNSPLCSYHWAIANS